MLTYFFMYMAYVCMYVHSFIMCKKLLLSWKVPPNHAPIKHFVFTHIHIQMNVDINKFAVHSF